MPAGTPALLKRPLKRGAQFACVGINAHPLPRQIFRVAPKQSTLRILQLIAGKNRDDICASFDFSGAPQFANACKSRRRSRLAADAIVRQRGLGLKISSAQRLAKPIGRANPLSAFFQLTGLPMRIAVASVCGSATGVNLWRRR